MRDNPALDGAAASYAEQWARRRHGEFLIDLAVKRMTGMALFAGKPGRTLSRHRFHLMRSAQACVPVIRIAR